jgi:predicted O-methyltransferase YrrM
MTTPLLSLDKIVESLPGWCSPAKARWITDWIAQNHPTRIVEIGVFGGRSLIPMGMAMKVQNELGQFSKGFVLGVDPYDPTHALEEVMEPEHKAWWNRLNYEEVYQNALRELTRRNLGDCCGILRTCSHEVLPLFCERTLDLVHIDGCHSRAASMRDVTTWLPLVRPGGLIVLDDVDWQTVHDAQQWLASRCDSLHGEKTWQVFQTRVLDPKKPPRVDTVKSVKV